MYRVRIFDIEEGHESTKSHSVNHALQGPAAGQCQR